MRSGKASGCTAWSGRMIEMGIELLKRYPGAKVTAIDYSPLSVEQAAEYNKNAVAAGRRVEKQGDVLAASR